MDIGKQIYDKMLEKLDGKNLYKFLGKSDICLPDDIEETDIDFGHQAVPCSDLESQFIDALNKSKTVTLNDGLSTFSCVIHDGCLFNKGGTKLGKCIDFVDEDDEYPEEYKDENNIVLDPETKEPLKQYILNEASKLYHDLDIEKTYVKYRFDVGFNKLINTDYVANQ